jgi:hypothetical protein
MAKKKDPEDFVFDVEEIVGVLKESDKHDWAKSVIRISWDGRPATIDIRNFNFNNNKPGKGISLTDEEVDSLVNMLIEKDYGSLETLDNAIEKKRSRLKPMPDNKMAYVIKWRA